MNSIETEDEIALDVVDRIDHGMKEMLKGMAFDDLAILHHDFGRWIRNTYGLWLRSEWKPVLIDGVDHAEDHPDAISFRIIQKVHTLLSTPK